MFGLAGGPDNELVSGSTKPLIYRKPDSASQTDAYPGLDDQGPVCPYPLTRVNMSKGLSECNADGPKPHFSNAENDTTYQQCSTLHPIRTVLLPGLKFSMMTSLLAASRFTSLRGKWVSARERPDRELRTLVPHPALGRSLRSFCSFQDSETTD